MYDVIAREKKGVQGYYTFIAKVVQGTIKPDDMVYIARRVSEQEANQIMAQYPQATRAKC